MTEKIINIGVIIGDAYSNYATEIMEGVYQAVDEIGINAFFFLDNHGNKGELIENGRNKLEHFVYQTNTAFKYSEMADIDVFIISTSTIIPFLQSETKEEFLSQFSNKPYVLLEEVTKKDRTSYLLCDNYGGMTRCVEHLLKDHGYRHIAFIGGPENSTEAQIREKAFRDVMDKYGMKVENTMIAHGDFSSFVDELVERILDQNENIEALVCANDEMATSVYRVCQKRNLVIGKDIAVTGFDDMFDASLLNPPLTTVGQSGFEKGYMGIIVALEMYYRDENITMHLNTFFRKRQSCGCPAVEHDLTNQLIYNKEIPLEYYMEETSGYILTKIGIMLKNEKIVSVYRSKLKNILYDIIRKAEEADQKDTISFDMNAIEREFLGFCEEKRGLAIEKDILAQCVSKLLFSVVMTLRNETAKEKVMLVIHTICNLLYSVDTRNYSNKYVHQQKEKRFAPLSIRNMMEVVGDDQKFYNATMELVREYVTGKAYLFLLEDPMIYHPNQRFTISDKLFLAVSLENGEVITYKEKQYIDKDNLFTDYFEGEAGHTTVCYTVFASNRHYGILVSDSTIDIAEKLYDASIHIGSVMRFKEITELEKKAKMELENSLHTISQRNFQLEYVSLMDELTGLYNRRGFIEQVTLECKKGKECLGWLVAFDIDHLKQINDFFGHAEGDYAIKSVANIMKECLPQGSILGRMGGDEYVALVCVEDNCFSLKLHRLIKEKFSVFNLSSNKPYFIEISIGYKHIKCVGDIDLLAMISEADTLLYLDKKNRRMNILK